MKVSVRKEVVIPAKDLLAFVQEKYGISIGEGSKLVSARYWTGGGVEGVDIEIECDVFTTKIRGELDRFERARKFLGEATP